MEIDEELKSNTNVAYISMEIAVDSNIPTYSGGLGVLSGDTVRSAADLELPMVGICLCYSSGYFYQFFNELGEQKEKEIEWNFFYEFEKVEKSILKLIGKDGMFAGDVSEQKELSMTMLKSLVKRSVKLEYRGHRVESVQTEQK